MFPHDLEKLLVITAIMVIPSLAIFTRLALRPIVDSIVRLRGSREPPPPLPPADDGRMAALEDEVRELRDSLDRLTAAVDFDAQLRAAAGNAQLRAAGNAQAATPLPPA